MKLFARYNRLNILATIVIFIVGSCAFYFLLHYVFIEQLDDTLLSERQEMEQYVRIHDSLPEIINTKDQHDAYTQKAPVTPEYYTARLDKVDDQELYRNIQFNLKIKGDNYVFVVSKPLEGTELLLKSIIFVTVVMIALILLTGLIINKRILTNIWQPFYNTIDQIKHYDVSNARSITLQPSDVEEFMLLNSSIMNMMDRVQEDYDSLKKFTGHAAHEMQTPLAVIRTRLDMLMQNENLLHINAPNIAEIEHAVQRLSKLNQSLLLLTKVENRQFALNDEVEIGEMIAHKCEEFAETMLQRNISLSLTIVPFTVRFHKHLAEIMLGNLVNNAIRYNTDNGRISIKLLDGILTVANTSQLPAIAQERVFQRFYRHNDVKAEGNGLGLSIVKQICDFAGFTVAYSYMDDMHVFSINFNSGSGLQ